jgi:hypothetical protein
MYMSALRDLLLAEDPRVLEVVLPNLAAYRAIKIGKDILVKKKAEMKKEVEKMERAGKRMGDTINVTAFQGATLASETAHSTSHAAATAKSKLATSKSPVRGISPMKTGAAEEKKHHIMQQQSASDFSSQEKESERMEIKKYGVRYSNIYIDYRGCSFGMDITTQPK